MKHWFFRTNFHVLSRYRIGKMTMLFLCLKRKVQKKSVGACTVCAIWGRSKFSSFSQPRKRWFGPILFSRKHRTPNASFPPTMTRRCAQLSWCFLKRKKSVQSQQQQWRKRDESLLQVILLRIGECINAKYCHRAASARQSQAKSHSATHR